MNIILKALEFSSFQVLFSDFGPQKKETKFLATSVAARGWLWSYILCFKDSGDNKRWPLFKIIL